MHVGGVKKAVSPEVPDVGDEGLGVGSCFSSLSRDMTDNAWGGVERWQSLSGGCVV